MRFSSLRGLDLAVLDQELSVRATMVGGAWVHREGDIGAADRAGPAGRT